MNEDYKHITSVGEFPASGIWQVLLTDDRVLWVPKSGAGRYSTAVKSWLTRPGNAVEALEPAPAPTNAQLVDLAGPVLAAFLKAYAKREGVSLATMRNAILQEM